MFEIYGTRRSLRGNLQLSAAILEVAANAHRFCISTTLEMDTSRPAWLRRFAVALFTRRLASKVLKRQSILAFVSMYS
jgi:hypothetical protein